MVDQDVVNTAHAVAKQLGATPKVMLSLFEAALVESGFRNLDYGDRDSLGYLQQRPSQGWPSPRDVTVATRSYVTRALANEKRNPGYTAGQLAQSVQVSAYPDRYDQREAEARQLLATVSGTSGADQLPVDDPSLTGAITGAAAALKGMVGSVTSIGALATQLTRLALPSTIVRIAAGILGIVFLFFGITLLGRQIKNG